MRPDLMVVLLTEALLTVTVYGTLLAGAVMLIGRSSQRYEPHRWRLDVLGALLLLVGLVGLVLWIR